MALPVEKGKLLTPKKLERFLVRLSETASVRQAASTANISLSTVYHHREKDPEFSAAWDKALDIAMDTVLEPEAVRRAVYGISRPVFYRGQKIANVKEYSDTLLIFLLNGGKPWKYARQRFEHTGANGQPLQIEIVHYVGNITGTAVPEENTPDIASPPSLPAAQLPDAVVYSPRNGHK